MGELDVECEVSGGGPSGQAGAIRFGLSRALQSFVDRHMVEKLRLGRWQHSAGRFSTLYIFLQFFKLATF